VLGATPMLPRTGAAVNYANRAICDVQVAKHPAKFAVCGNLVGANLTESPRIDLVRATRF